VLLLALAGCESEPEALPGELVAFVPLGTAALGTHEVELAGRSGQTLLAELTRRGATNVDQARDALELAPGSGERAFAFVLPGCAETGAVLVSEDGGVGAELTGGEDTNCAGAVHFLATFRISAEDVRGVGIPTTEPSKPARDLPAVLAALRRLDPCALAEPVGGDGAGLTPVPRGPHRCDLKQNSATVVQVTLGTPLSTEEHPLRSIALGGVRAYDFDEPSGCGVRIPVHPTLAISFDGKDGVQACQQTREVASVAAPRLEDPDAVRIQDPGAGWDACTALATVTGRFDELVPGYGDHGIDSCGVAEKAPGGLTPVPDTRLDISYGIDPTQDTDLAGYQYTTIGGRTVRVLSSECSFAWSHGFVGARQQARVIELVAPDCTSGKTHVAKLIQLMSGDPPVDVSPQDPLTYGMDEPDPICVNPPQNQPC
jgi:hypothetical protein